mmetsp:Transcript_11602/g.17572  ORF Transcript_11602/g.17572 Transcript_11602/m.17572 type:complete len:337 (-) Transcript_11602:180-1190(-)
MRIFLTSLALLSAPHLLLAQDAGGIAPYVNGGDCTDSPAGWMDALENTCAYYEEHPFERCMDAEIIKSDAGSAADVCCACGGGTSGETAKVLGEEEEEEEEAELPKFNLGCGLCYDDKGFTDALFNKCDWYEEYTYERCLAAPTFNTNGHGALDACCACGGGTSEGCEGPYYIQNVYDDLYILILYGQVRPPFALLYTRAINQAALKIKDLGSDTYAIGSDYYDDRWLCVGGDKRGITSCQTIGYAAKWKIEAVKGKKDQYTIKSASDGRYMDALGMQLNNGAYSIALAKKSVDQATRWRLIKRDDYSLSASAAEDEGEDELLDALATVKKNLRST